MKTLQGHTSAGQGAGEKARDGERPTVVRPITRRKMLSGLLLTTAGTASLTGLGRPQVARADVPTGTTMTRGGNLITVGPIRAPDGLPQASVQGTLVGTNGNGAYLMVDTGDSVIPVTVLPATQLLAAGAAWSGTLSPLAVGDNLFIFTTIVESGERIAVKIEQNPGLYRMSVASISGSALSGAVVAPDATAGASLQLTISPLTVFPPSGAPQLGDTIQVATVSNSPVDPSETFAMNINLLS